MVIYTCPKCGVDLSTTVICTYPPINVWRCLSCGWKHEEAEEVQRMPFGGNFSGLENIEYLTLDKSTNL